MVFTIWTSISKLVSDNGPQFTSTEFEHFVKSNGVKHIFTSSYHPSSNRGAERFVQTIKNGLRTANIQTGNSEQKLRNFLLAYGTTPNEYNRTNTIKIIPWSSNSHKTGFIEAKLKTKDGEPKSPDGVS